MQSLDELHWDHMLRAPSDTLVETRRGWKMLKQLTLKPNNGRFLPHVLAIDQQSQVIRLVQTKVAPELQPRLQTPSLLIARKR
jgi:hypothetical protein